MESSTRASLDRLAHRAHAGELHFGLFIGQLIELGVESYRVDHRLASMDFFLRSDLAHPVVFPPVVGPIGSTLHRAALKAAIGGAQRGELRYPQFVDHIVAAGVVGYYVWIRGAHVVYFGRSGEQHVEHFPTAAV